MIITDQNPKPMYDAHHYRSSLAELKIVSIYIIIVLWLFIFFSCSTTGDWANEINWKEIDFNKLPTQVQYPDAEAVVLLDEGQVQIFQLPEYSFSTYDRHSVVKILNERGYHLANVAVAYGSRSEVTDIEARTISPDGEIILLDPKTIFDVNLYPNFVFYSDQRAKIFTLPAIQNNCVIEYRYKITLYSHTYGNFWRFQSTIPVEISRFTLVKPRDWELDYRFYDFVSEPESREVISANHKTLTWEVRDLTGLKSELAMPPIKELGARMMLRPVGVQNWQDIASWYHDLVQPQMSANNHILEMAQNLTVGIGSDREKLHVIFEWVRDQIRYIAVSIGIGGYQPHPVEDIFQNKYGDCKDMTTLLCTLAEEVGIEVYQALISTKKNGIPDTTLPSASHFNHVIAYAPDLGEEGIWMDATEKTAPFGSLPWYDQDLPVLLIGEEGSGQILYTPKSTANHNLSSIEWKVILDSNAEAEVTGKTSAWGATANEIRENFYHLADTEREDLLRLYLNQRCSGVTLNSFTHNGLENIDDPLVLNYNFTCSNFARMVQGNMVLLPGDIFQFELPRLFANPVRSNPIRFNFASGNDVSFSIQIPERWRVSECFSPDSVLSDFGSFYRKISYDTYNIKLIYSYRFTGEDIPADKYDEFQEFLQKVRIRNLDEVVLAPD